MTIGTLPDDVLIKIFKFFVDAMYHYYTTSEKWCVLVHVCRRWRNLAFTCPRHLNLQIFFRPPERSVNRMLDIWPKNLPIHIHAFDCSTKVDRDDVVAAFRLNHRVSVIHLEDPSDSAWETFRPLMNHPFPALTNCWVQRSYDQIKDTISFSFLGGSAPSLRDLHLDRVPFPALPNLLLSATNLVSLWYDNIPRSGYYISPQEMVTGLSALTRLDILSLTFQSPEPLPDRELRIPPPHARTLLPALTHLRFRGVPEYMEYLVVQIHNRLLKVMEITFFHREVLEVSELAKFIRTADKLSLVDRGEVTFTSEYISIKLSEQLWSADAPKTLMFYSACFESEFRLSYLAQLCASCFATPSPFESLYIRIPLEYMWEDVMDDPDDRWLDLLRAFSTVKHLHLSRTAASRVAQALRRLPLERVTEVLPALEIVFLSGPEHFGSVMEALTEFADARQVSGHPVSIYD